VAVIFPLPAGAYTWGDGWRVPDRPDHRGIDFAAAFDTEVRAPVGGWATQLDEPGGAGLWIRLECDDGIDRRFFHLAERIAFARVEAGSLVGLVGSTGASTGPHLHYERWEHGRDTDPAPELHEAEHERDREGVEMAWPQAVERGVVTWYVTDTGAVWRWRDDAGVLVRLIHPDDSPVPVTVADALPWGDTGVEVRAWHEGNLTAYHYQ
jgi:murein DD-endopeptidase MepM/ murein hydrolase activator NlpD